MFEHSGIVKQIDGVVYSSPRRLMRREAFDSLVEYLLREVSCVAVHLKTSGDAEGGNSRTNT